MERIRRSYALSDMAKEHLENGKGFLDGSKDALLSKCVEFAFSEKEKFSEFIHGELLKHFEKAK